MLVKSISCLKLLYNKEVQNISVRSIFGWFDAAFNNYDEARVKEVGPDRAAAEWILRCGGKVTWDNGGTINDYNKLPAGGYRKLKISAIDGSDSCIMEHGFLHFKGLDSFTKMSLVNNKYLTDDSMGELVRYARNKLRWLHLAENGNISDSGLLELQKLRKLEYLKLEKLQELKRPEETFQTLRSNMPSCQIEFPPFTNEESNNEDPD